VKLGKSAAETPEILHEILENILLSRTTVFDWYSRVKAGRISVEDDERSGRPTTSKTTENVEKKSITNP
jgi:hypothetical protein